MMDELDNEARDLIRRACFEESRPSLQTRSRVQHAVAAVLATTTATAATLVASTSSASALGSTAAAGVAAGSSKLLTGFGTLGAVGLKTWFVCGVACGVGLTASGFGVWWQRDTSLGTRAMPSAAASASIQRRGAARPPPTLVPTLAKPNHADADPVLANTESPEPGLDASGLGLHPSEPLHRRMTSAAPAAPPAPSQQQRVITSRERDSLLTTPTLAAEVRLLTVAQTQLRNGQAQAALKALEQDDGRFAASPLRSDLDAIRILALCQLGRGQAAEMATRAFLSAHPHSPHVLRIRSACGFSLSPTPASPPAITSIGSKID